MDGKRIMLLFFCVIVLFDILFSHRDRTAQICATTQVLLDPFFRTIEGLAVLIEKDWCAFGHKFQGKTPCIDRLCHHA